MSGAVRRNPMYAQLRDLLMERLASGGLAPGARMPSERELCEEFGVSKHTVIKALTELVAMGLVRREQGRGTFVAGSRARVGTLRLVFYRTTGELSFDAYYAHVLGAAEAFAGENGYDLALSSVREGVDSLVHGDAGYLMVGPVPDGLVMRAAERGVPVVVVDHPACPRDADVVAFDEEASGGLAARALLSRGCGSVGYAGEYDALSSERREWPNSVLRLEGVRRALGKAGLALREEHVLSGVRPSDYERALRRAARLGALPEGWVAFSDARARTLLGALEKLGRAPKKMSVVSFGGQQVQGEVWDRARIVGDTRRLGLEAAKLLLERIGTPGREPRRIMLRRRLVEGGRKTSAVRSAGR